MNFFQLIHPIMLKGYQKIHKKNLHILQEKIELTENVIYMVNHSCRWDTPVAASAIEDHVYSLIGKQPLNVSDRIGLTLNGTIWVDRKNKVSREKAYEKMKQFLQNQMSILLFPEATWNLSDSKPMLPIYWGGIRLSMETGKPIVPIVMEYKGTEDVYLCFGMPMYFSEYEDKQKCANAVRDAMATLRWKIWEEFPVEKRRNIDMEEWHREACRRVEEYPKLNYEYEMSCIRQM